MHSKNSKKPGSPIGWWDTQPVERFPRYESFLLPSVLLNGFA